MLRRPLRIPLLALLLCGSHFAVADDAPPTVQKLIETLHSEDKQTRRDATAELGRRGAAAAEAVPALIKLIEDPDQQIGMNALTALAGIGPAAREAIPALIDSLDGRKMRGGRASERNQAAMRAANALSRIGAVAIPSLNTAVASPDGQQRAGAARALGGMSEAAAEAVPALIQNLGDGSDSARQEAIDALAQIGAPAKSRLIAALSDGDAKRRAGAASALTQLGSAAPDAAPIIAGALQKEKDPSVRAALLSALPKTGAGAAQAVPLLVAAAQDENESVRHAAINALAGTRDFHQPATRALMVSLKDPKAEVRQWAARALGRLGPDAAEALPALIVAARQETGSEIFANALTEMGPSALPAILAALKEGNTSDFDWTFRAMRGFGISAISTLTELLGVKDARIQVAACETLGALGPAAKEALPRLRDLVSAADPVQDAAKKALSRIEPPPR